MREMMEISEQGVQYIQDFLDALINHDDLNPKTLKEYTSDLRHFIGWYETVSRLEKPRLFQIGKISTSTIIQYQEHAYSNMQLKPSTINRRLVTLKRYFHWAASESKIKRDPAKPVKLLPEKKPLPRQMTDQEESALFAAVTREGTLRDQTLILVLLHTGLRTMEICDLIPEDIHLGKDRCYLTVRSGARHNSRIVPLSPACKAALKAYLAALPSSSPYLFPSEKTGTRLTERAVRHLIHKYTKAAGLEGLSAQDLRHRFGYLAAAKIPLLPLAQIMGHENPDTTLIYVKTAQP